MEQKPTLRGRALIAVCLAAGLFALTLSGFALFTSPTGRIARDMGWMFLGLDKFAWEDVHMACALFFVLASLFHIFLNWTPLANHIRQKGDALLPFRIRIEAVLAIALCALFVFSAIKHFPPGNVPHDVREAIEDYWADGSDND